MCLDTSSTISRSRAWFWSFHLKIWIFVKETCENPHCDMWQSGSRGTIAWSRSQAGLGESGSDSQSHLWKGDRSSSMPGVWTSFSFMNFSTKVEIISWFKICSKGDAALYWKLLLFFSLPFNDCGTNFSSSRSSIRRNASISSRCHCSIDGVAFSIGSIGHSGREK